MGYEVRLTAKARGDLNEIVAYIAQDNPLAAERLGDELAAQADSLSNYPYRSESSAVSTRLSRCTPSFFASDVDPG